MQCKHFVGVEKYSRYISDRTMIFFFLTVLTENFDRPNLRMIERIDVTTIFVARAESECGNRI